MRCWRWLYWNGLFSFGSFLSCFFSILFRVLFAFLSHDEAPLTLFMAERVDGFDIDVASYLKEKGMMLDGWLDRWDGVYEGFQQKASLAGRSPKKVFQENLEHSCIFNLSCTKYYLV